VNVELLAVEGIGEVTAGAELAQLVVAALADAGEALRDGDVVVVSSKIVSKAEGRSLAAPSRDAAVDAETVRVVAERTGPRGLTRIVQSRSGPVLAAAGVDASNVAPGTVLLLPADPDRSARELRAALTRATGALLGVVVSDTAGRAWREGQLDLAIGAAGVRVTDDLRGGTDPYGNPLEATVRALVDEVASAADLVKGKLRAVPVAVLRGLADLVTAEDGPGAAALLRGPGADWFALGHVEAVRTALGAPPGTPGVEPVPMIPDRVDARLRRAVAVALAAPGPFDGAVTAHHRPGGDDDVAAVALHAVSEQVDRAAPVPLLALGAAVQRLVSAAWAEGLTATAVVHDDGVTVTVRPAR
jgi:coenzyme F420-0:L-glutamate ligase/coenzyme F420-1:gamma-L-glutamate ligase